MTRKVTAVVARTQFGQLVNRAVEHHDRFLVERHGEPSVLILSVDDFITMVETPPDWLKKSWASAKRHGLDKLTPAGIDAEVNAARRARRKST